MNQHHFTIQHGDYSADIVLGGEWSLYDLAEYIIKTIGFDFDHSFEFCDNLKNPYRSKERYTLFADMGDDPDYNDPGVQNTLVSTVFKPKRKMIFHFDYGDDWHFLVTCKAVKPSEKKRRFRSVLTTQGTPPTQYPNYDEEDV
ncbi:plasmid pRiA4b ORF-3 family protein [Phragmitibacter flavus]|uniref:Plasmid pRiA4b ORF-3 family protein n=1 Tax=Phragmitibacter flavus TaxID=2576071 RepID=A0A5R8K945_9BACT|nr:plasmid pRiA4b ORF-3 family protein [Phragmitibacter flavus]TLD68810.1 plasmid pRiA4b ORF-3 family protein [Phragmitibacter flavus]